MVLNGIIFVIMVVMGAVATYGFSKGWFGRTETEHRLARARLLAISEVRPGQRAKVKGAVSSIGPLMTSPIGARKCIGFRSTIQQLHGDGHNTVFEECACAPF